MKDVWVLSIKTSLPETPETYESLKYAVRVFADFGAARDALRAELKRLAFQKNPMFDGDGGLIYLDRYIERSDDWGEDVEDLTQSRLQTIRNALATVFRGEEAELPLEDGFYTDYMIAATVSGNTISFRGDDDGPFNGYDPRLATNLFSMNERGNWYYLYINDLFGQEYSSELYIDLRKARLEE